MSVISLFRSIENMHDVYRGKYCMKKFCESLRQHAMKIIDFKKKKILTKEQEESYENAKISFSENKYMKYKKCCKLRDHCHYTRESQGVAHRICYLRGKTLF